METFKKRVLGEFRSVSFQFDEFRASLNVLSSKVESYIKVMDDTRREFGDIKKENGKLRLENQFLDMTVNDLKDRVKRLEQFFRKTNAKINRETMAPKEDFLSLLKDTKKGIGKEIQDTQVTAGHRTSTFKKDRTPLLFNELQSRKQRDSRIPRYKNKKYTLMSNEDVMVKKVGKHHYLATHAQSPHYPDSLHRGYSTDGEESQRAASDRTMSEYTVTNERARVVPPPRKHRPRGRRSRSEERPQYSDQDGSDIYVTSAAYRAPSEISRGSRHSRHTPSHYSYRAPSEVSTIKTKVDTKRGVVVETMSAPNPFCPHTRGMCCLMLLLNLGLILVTLGIVIVVQFFQPVFVWILGIVFLIFGFLTLVGSLIYCVAVCRDSKTPAQVAAEDHYWTRHWSKNIGSPPEIHYRADDKYSDRY